MTDHSDFKWEIGSIQVSSLKSDVEKEVNRLKKEIKAMKIKPSVGTLIAETGNKIPIWLPLLVFYLGVRDMGPDLHLNAGLVTAGVLVGLQAWSALKLPSNEEKDAQLRTQVLHGHRLLKQIKRHQAQKDPQSTLTHQMPGHVREDFLLKPLMDRYHREHLEQQKTEVTLRKPKMQ